MSLLPQLLTTDLTSPTTVIAVNDLGGGTFDISILEMQKDVFEGQVNERKRYYWILDFVAQTYYLPSGKLRSLTHIAVVDGFEANPANFRGLRIGIDASIWFFHAVHGREGENPELRTLFFRCARLTSAPFLPLFIFDGPKRPKEIIEAFGFEWRMAPGEAEAELAHLNSIGVIDAVLSDDVDNFLFGAKMVIRSSSVNLSGNSKHTMKNADGRVDDNHSTVYTSADILVHPSVQLTRGGLILIGLLSGGDYHPAGLARCGTGIAHRLAKCGFGDELLKATQSLTRDELPDFLTTWREDLRSELRTNSRGHLGSKKPSLAKAVPDAFPDIDVLLSYTNPIISATDASVCHTHTLPRWEREPDLARLAHFCELRFEWGLKDIIIKRFRTILWPSIVLRALRRSALEAAAVEPPSPPLPRSTQIHRRGLQPVTATSSLSPPPPTHRRGLQPIAAASDSSPHPSPLSPPLTARKGLHYDTVCCRYDGDDDEGNAEGGGGGDVEGDGGGDVEGDDGGDAAAGTTRSRERRQRGRRRR
ncbi:hypothetical protein EDB85DRAFT_2289635 [Lactarius pseudohatsudake]|nr:hypothetical protein EDB85DRAFT_2289635 [Lactarius pseudohatsudake]